MLVLGDIWRRITTRLSGDETQGSRSAQAGAPASIAAVTAEPRIQRVVNPKVLVVDDEEPIRSLVRATLTREGREVFVAANGVDALDVFREERPDITILDLHMPGMNGLEVLRKIRAICPAAIVVIFTGDQSEASVREAQKLGVTEFLQKGESFQDAWERRTRRL